MTAELFRIFIDASDTFVTNQKGLILSGVSEQCLCGSLMTYLRYRLDESQFSNYHVDVEYNRNYDGRIKKILNDNIVEVTINCDIVVHGRGEQDVENLIAIEMKKAHHSQVAKDNDRKRLIALTSPIDDPSVHLIQDTNFPVYVRGYLLGVFYEVDASKNEINIEYYQRGELYKTFQKAF